MSQRRSQLPDARELLGLRQLCLHFPSLARLDVFDGILAVDGRRNDHAEVQDLIDRQNLAETVR